MEEGYIDKFDIERIVSAIEQEFDVEEIEKGEYAIERIDNGSSETHVVNLKTLHCSCKDYEFNCSPKEKELGDKKVCKHIYHCIFRVHSLLP